MSFRHLFLSLLLIGASLTATAQTIPGTLSVKFTAAAADALTVSEEGDAITTGFASIDRLNAQFGVTEMTRIFRPAGRFEERHRAFGLHRWYTLTIPQDVAVQTAMDAYQADPNIEIAEPVYEKTFTDGHESGMEPQIVDAPRGPRTASGKAGIPNDPLFGDQWHYDNTGQTGGTPGADISLPEAHDIQTGDPSVIVSIHDMGIDVDHEDLAANMWVNEGEIPGNEIDDDNNGYVDDVYGYNFADNQGTITPGYHGVHVAGTVAAVTNNGIGVAGVAGGDGTPDSGIRLMSAQVFGNANGGMSESYPYAADMGAVISQNSWGYTQSGVYEQSVLDGIDYYIANAGNGPGVPMEGGLVIFAAGNSSSSSEWYPGYYEPTVAVASTNIDDEKSVWSNFGEWVDISASGGTNYQPYNEEDVLSTLENNQYGYLAGTSMACPHASGVAALILSQNPGTTNLQVRTILELATDDIDPVNPNYVGLLGTGRINALTAVMTEPDTTGPAAVADLAGTPDGDFVTLTWTAPSDEEGFGVQGYRMRYALAPIVTEADWENATVVSVAQNLAPQEPGETEELVVADLDFETTYHFSVRSWDGLNFSNLSNSEEVTTLPSPTAIVPVDPIEVALPADAQETVGYTVSNAGPALLRYTLDFVDPTEGLERTPISKPVLDSDRGPDPSEREEAPPRDGVEESSPSGEPQRMDSGGPDAFGYRWVDSNEPNGPTYSWVDITETGTQVDIGLDDHVIVDLPFNFPYYENTFDWIAIQSKGALSFNDVTLHYANQQIPVEDAGNGVLAGYWDDLNPSSSGGVYYDTLEDGRFVVSWIEVPHYGNVGTFTFQIILDPSGGIVYQYQTVDGGGTHDNSATVGIENLDGTDGLQVVYNAPYVEDGLAVQFTNWLNVDVRSGELAAGEEQTHTLVFNSTGLEPGTHTTSMIVTTNQSGEALTQEYVVPVSLTVQGVGTEGNDLDFEGTHRLSAVAPNPISGLAQTTLEVAEVQDVTVELFDVRGRKVTTLLEGAIAARTAEEIMLDGSGLAPGVYVIRIAGETFAETRRVTIVR